MKYLVALIKFFEGCFLVAYRCPAGVWTCGWGSTGSGIVEGTVWTQAQADARMGLDAEGYYAVAAKLSPVITSNEKIRAAVADFCYNLGVGRYKASTFKRRIDEGDYEDAIYELKKWIRGGGKILPGLVKRRYAEAVLITEGANE